MNAFPFLPRRAAGSRRRRFALLTGLLLTVAALVPFVTHGAGQADSVSPKVRRAATAKGAKGGAAFVPGRILVRFRDDATVAQDDIMTGGTRSTGHALLLDAEGTQINARIESFEGSTLVPGLRLAYVAPEETLSAIEALRARADVLYAEPDYVRHSTATPNDPSFAQLYAMTKINATGAWDTTTGGGASVVVGIVDEGVDIQHPDLAANIWTNPGEIAGNGIDDDGNGKVDDINGWDFSTCTGAFTITTPPSGCGNNTVYDGPGIEDPTDGFPTDGHGTHVAGTIGAVGNNATGVVGVNWNVKLLPLKFLGTSGGASSNAIRAEAYAKALRDKWVATNGAQGANVRVLNNSYGGGGSSQAELDSIKAVGDSGILFVVAAGNESANNDFVPAFPANYDAPNLIAVASSTSNDAISGFSNIGARLVSVAAPGSSILSTISRTSAAQPYGYAFLSGTSMATPHVAGLAALICSLNPQIDVLRLRSLIAYNGDIVSFYADKIYTQRRINALKSVQAAQENDTTAPAPVNFPRVAGQIGRFVILNFTAPGDDGNTGTAALYEASFVSATDGKTYVLKTAIPDAAGGGQAINVNVPLRQTAGSIRIKAIDNVGNESAATLPVSVDISAADPYTTAETANSGLSPIGTALGFHADDDYRTVSLPAGFSFPFFGQTNSSVVVSSNGNLYFQPLSTLPPANPANDQFGDSGSSTQQLEGFRMAAGLWDDLRTDCAGNGTGAACDVYVNTSDPDRVIFRWEARTFLSTSAESGNPVEFEIELNRDGTIRERYGAGNTNVSPVVGIGAGEQGGSYVITSHTSPNAPISLTNAQAVTIAPRPAGAQATSVQFASANFNTSEDNTENTPRATITITRTGDTSGTSSVSYRTVDDMTPVRCDVTNGTAFARCDYTTAVGTVTFAGGETSKTFTVPVVDDAFVEGPETFHVQLSNPVGATLGTTFDSTVTIADNDAFSTANPIFNTDFFVRQHYLDFLSREPEAGQPWSAVLNNCPSGDTSCDRISVSANFFRSQEFELKGRFVFRFYKVAFGRLPLYSEIIPDMASVTGTTTAEVQAKKAAFTNDFTQRPAFKAAFDGLTNQQFVDTLMNRYGIQQITTPDPVNPDSTTKIVLTRANLVNRLNGIGGTLTRGQVLRAIADSDEVGAAEFNSSFVAMQYFGYLRRDPDTQGFNNWLQTLNNNPNDFRGMVNGFMNSAEYRLRFGPQ